MTTRNFRVNNGLEVGDITISASANTITGGATAAPSADGQFANKKYVDDSIAAISQSAISQLNSNVTVTDSGTGKVEITVDGTEVADFAVAATTITATGAINLSAGSDVVIPTNIGLHFTDANEKIESNGTDLTINAGADINLTATNDVNIPADVGITFGDDGEKIEGDGTDLTIATSGALNINNTGTCTVAGALTVTGNLTVNGTTSTVNSVNTTIADNLIELNSGISASSNDAGFIIERGSTGNNAAIIWDESADKFTMGTTTATAADKSGGITVSAGTLVATCSAAQYSDVAERYHSDSPYNAGTIVQLGGVNEITQTAEELSEDVFGVVSSNDTAAFMMNDRTGYSDLTHPFVAMTGRVPTNVVGTVTKGARLVTSSTPGYARMAQPGEATAFNVVGRALDSITTEGMGQVLAVVSFIV